MELSDVQIQCSTCGREFIFTVKEQEFFNSKGFKAPKHCRECRQKRKQEREKLYTSNVTGGSGAERPKIKVVCAVCNRETTVPFKPITGKPVLCKDCFIAQKYGSKEGVQTPPETEQPAEQPTVEEAKTKRPSAAAEAIPQDEAPIDLHEVEKQQEPTVDSESQAAEVPEETQEEAEEDEEVDAKPVVKDSDDADVEDKKDLEETDDTEDKDEVEDSKAK